MKRRTARIAAILLLGLTALLTSVQGAAAHPMGNFSINHYAAITVSPGLVRVLYIVDMAEIPTFQELSSLGAATGADVAGARRASYLSREARSLAGRLSVEYARRPVRLSIQAEDLIFPPGAGGLSTERVYLVLAGSLTQAAGALSYADSNFAGRAGWKEIVLRSVGGVRIQQPSAPSFDRSNTLTVYPSLLTSSPPQDTTATLYVRAPSALTARNSVSAMAVIKQAERPLFTRDGSWSALARGLARTKTQSGASGTSFAASRDDPLSALMDGRQLSVGVLLISLVVAFWFGAGHALSPGHGKTIVAAYLVGSRGTAAHAAFLGLTVTATHTAGVFALGLVTLYLSGYVLPDQLYPILGFASGMLVALMGATLFVRRLRARLSAGAKSEIGKPSVPSGLSVWSRSHTGGAPWAAPASHPVHFQPVGMAVLAAGVPSQGAATLAFPRGGSLRDRGSREYIHGSEARPHRHGPFGLPHTHAPAATSRDDRVTVRSLLTLGISGGLLPCPSALVVLLSAIAFHRVAFGMLLIVAFSLGLATVLTGIGILVVFSSRLLGKVRPASGVRRIFPIARQTAQILPIFSAFAVAVLGSLIALGAADPGVLPAFIPKL
jgi:ABC-type nickel/cobalt efflux system permease component RcnA